MPTDPDTDPFRPPAVNTMVGCLHCQEEYDSYRIEWREGTDPDGTRRGYWCCPMPGCDGRGFGFDILPTDPNYHDERGGWVSDDEDDDFEDEEFDDEDEDDEDYGEWEEPDPDRPPAPPSEEIPY